MFDPSKPMITLTDKAADRVKSLVEGAPEDGILGLRVGVKTVAATGSAISSNTPRSGVNSKTWSPKGSSCSSTRPR